MDEHAGRRCDFLFSHRRSLCSGFLAPVSGFGGPSVPPRLRTEGSAIHPLPPRARSIPRKQAAYSHAALVENFAMLGQGLFKQRSDKGGAGIRREAYFISGRVQFALALNCHNRNWLRYRENSLAKSPRPGCC